MYSSLSIVALPSAPALHLEEVVLWVSLVPRKDGDRLLRLRDLPAAQEVLRRLLSVRACACFIKTHPSAPTGDKINKKRENYETHIKLGLRDRLSGK